MKIIKCLVMSMLLATVVVLAGCETLGSRSRHRATSVMKFLYPSDSERIVSPSIPTLSLPLKVGIAFVPIEQSTRAGREFFSTLDTTVNEQQKMALMKEVSKRFEKYPFVKSIELIPSAYLTAGGSFANLDQLRSMFGVDVIALLSYDQVQFTDEGLLSLTYWTIVGVYAIQGEKNDTRTMLDAVVYDIPSRRMLFRAPGVSEVKGSATPINLSAELRRDSERGFHVAATNLVTALDFQLGEFKERIKKSPEEIKVVHKPGYVGGAASGPIEIALVGALGLAGLFLRRKGE